MHGFGHHAHHQGHHGNRGHLGHAVYHAMGGMRGGHGDGDFGHGMGGMGGAMGGGRGGRGGGRIFGHGGLRFVLLQLIADKPSHGYELIRAIEERLGGQYSPSPGVVYPTLTMLEEQGYITQAAQEGGRNQSTITPAGREFLEANREVTDALMARMQPGQEPGAGRPPQVVRAIENVKLALRLRLARGPLSNEEAHALAAVLDSAAQNIEKV